MVAADSNVILRLIAQDHAQQLQTARAVLEEGLWLSHVVVAEVVWVLQRRYAFTPADVAETIDRLRQTSAVAFEDDDVIARAVTTFRDSRSVDFADCLILEIARKANQLPLATFDRHLARIDGAHLLR